MNKPTSLTRWTATALIALAAGLGATAAQAGGVQWSVGINVPVPGVVVYPQPQVVVAPQPVYMPPRPVYVQPEPMYMARPHHHHHHHHHHRDEWAGDDRYARPAPRGYGW